jgi:hypothetical protein
MRRVALGLILVVLATGAALPPDCAEQIRVARAKLLEMKESPRRQELLKLVEKAEHDRDAGRIDACGRTMLHARELM